MRKLIVSAFFFVATFASSINAGPTITKKFNLDTEKGKVVVEFTQASKPDGSVIRNSRYISGGKLLSESHEEFNAAGIIQVETTKDYVCGREDNIHREGDSIVNSFKEKWGAETRTYSSSASPDVTFGSGIINTINDSLEILKSGGRVDLKFYVPEKTDWFTLRIVGWDDVLINGIHAKKITIEPVSFFLKLFVSNSYYIIDPNTKIPLELNGTFSHASTDCNPVKGSIKFFPIKKRK